MTETLMSSTIKVQKLTIFFQSFCYAFLLGNTKQKRKEANISEESVGTKCFAILFGKQNSWARKCSCFFLKMIYVIKIILYILLKIQRKIKKWKTVIPTEDLSSGSSKVFWVSISGHLCLRDKLICKENCLWKCDQRQFFCACFHKDI